MYLLFSDAKEKKTFKRRKFPCQICKIDVTRFAEHLDRKHKEVLEGLSDEERRNKIKMLRTTHARNFNAAGGKLKTRECENITPCPNCCLFYSTKNLFRHVKECRTSTILSQRELMAKSREKAIKLSKPSLPERVVKILAAVKDKEVRKILETDDVLIEYVQYLTKKQASKHHLDNYIRTLSIGLTKFFIRIKEVRPEIKHLKEVFDPMYIKDVFASVEYVGGMTETSCRSPNMIRVLRTSIKHAAERYDVMLATNSELDRNMKREKREILGEFLRIYLLDFLPSVGSVAAEFARKKIMAHRQEVANII